MPSHYRGSPSERRALDTYIKLVRAAQTLLAHVDAEVAKAGITHPQFGVLEALHHLGTLSQGQLCDKLLISAGNATMIVKNLEKRRLVTRERRHGDRRVVEVGLAPEGAALITALMPRVAARVKAALASLKPAEQAQLGLLCKRLGLAVKQADGPRA